MLAKVLVAEDEAAVRALIARRLEKNGFRVVEAVDGEDALSTVAARQVDLVLLDIMMPGLSGMEVLGRLRQTYPPVKLPIIMATAMGSGPTVVEAFRLGANDYITKPIDFDLLLKRMRAHLALKAGRGSQIGPYQIVERLGVGGMGTVFAANDMNTGQRVALKVLRRALTHQDAYVMRFLREARIASRLRHPNLVPCLGSGKDEETFFLAMEYIAGKNVRELVKEGPLEISVALDVARQIAAALGVVAAAGLIHRDVKPENIIVNDAGKARLTDFGLIREADADARLTEEGRWVGSLVYASPEQMVAGGDHRTDIYGLGGTLFTMLTGHDPFDASLPFEKLVDLKRRRPPRARNLNPLLSKPIANLVARMMAPRPQKRPATFEEVASELGRLLGEAV